MHQRMEPAFNIVTRLGGPSVVARIAGVHRTRVSNWMRPKEKGGTGGRIPQDHHRSLLEYAREHGVALTAEDFIPNERVA
jgi:monoamine oxidase